MVFFFTFLFEFLKFITQIDKLMILNFFNNVPKYQFYIVENVSCNNKKEK